MAPENSFLCAYISNPEYVQAASGLFQVLIAFLNLLFLIGFFVINKRERLKEKNNDRVERLKEREQRYRLQWYENHLSNVLSNLTKKNIEELKERYWSDVQTAKVFKKLGTLPSETRYFDDKLSHDLDKIVESMQDEFTKFTSENADGLEKFNADEKIIEICDKYYEKFMKTIFRFGLNNV